MGQVEHECEYKQRVEELEAKLDKVMRELDQFRRKVLGPSSERLPSVDQELKRRGDKPPADKAKTREKRKANAEARDAALVEEHEESRVPEDQRTCPCCGKEAKTISQRKTSSVVDYVPGYFRKRVIHRETVACSCGMYVQMAPPPPRVLGQSKYGAGFVAHLVVAKVLDSIPIYRLEKRFKRFGIPMPRSTMNDLANKAGVDVRILVNRQLELIAAQAVVLADETSLPVKDTKKTKRGFIWTFSARLMMGDDDDDGPILVAYRYSKDRSGQTPAQVLGGSTGVLLVDGYTGYNAVTSVDGRTRAACLAHVRRKFFDAKGAASDRALELILDVYRVEHEALERGIVRTAEHAELRRTKGRAAMNAFHRWLVEQEPHHGPASGIGKAVRHALKNWDRLCVFLDDVNVPIDNNFSEASLRPIAKGRDNWMYAGTHEAAENIAALLTLTATCEANGINPELYLADVLERLPTHPQSELDDLLPHNWRRLYLAAAEAKAEDAAA